MAHLKATMKKHPKLSLGEAMSEAKKTYKKHGGGIADTATPVSQETGPLVNTKGAVEGFLVKTGGRRHRRKSHRKTHKGGQLYGFGEQGGTLSDGMGRMTPTGSVADAAAKSGGRRRRHHTRRHTRRR
jgi:hypothetical protein